MSMNTFPRRWKFEFCPTPLAAAAAAASTYLSFPHYGTFKKAVVKKKMSQNSSAVCEWSIDSVNSSDSSVYVKQLVWDFNEDGSDPILAIAQSDHVIRLLRGRDGEALGEPLNVAGENIYDFAFWKGREACSVVVCARDMPVQIYTADVVDGEKKGWTRGISIPAFRDRGEDLLSPHACAQLDGARLVVGYARQCRVYDVTRQGSHFQTLSAPGKQLNQALALYEGDTFVVGDASGWVGVVDMRTSGGKKSWGKKGQQYVRRWRPHKFGVSDLHVVPGMHAVYSGGQREDAVQCWDLRHNTRAVERFGEDAKGDNDTGCMQRWRFDVSAEGRWLVKPSNAHVGGVAVFDMHEIPDEVGSVTLPSRVYGGLHPVDMVTAVAMAPSLSVFASSSGHPPPPRSVVEYRHPRSSSSSAMDVDDGDSSGGEQEDQDRRNNSVRVSRWLDA
jgi:hypothetical protein